MVGKRNDANGIALQTVNQGIGKAMERKRPRLVCAAFAQRGKLFQQIKGAFNFIDEVISRNERTFTDIPVNSGISIGPRFFAKTDSRYFLRHELLREAET